jgi:chemotaxis protein methyltransferase CheR
MLAEAPINYKGAYSVDSDLLVLNALIRREFGIDFSEHLDQLKRKITARLIATGVADVRGYVQLLEYAPQRANELSALADAVANNETYFFRESSQLEAICRMLIPSLMARLPEKRAIKILSLPCSTGEEPYSLVMQLMMNDDALEHNVRIFAADLSERALEAAKAGKYRPLSFRSTTPDIIQRFFTHQAGWSVIDANVARRVTFFRANLVDVESLQAEAPYDIILCRNVLIYFQPTTRDQVMSNLAAVLAADGYLCLGHADTIDGFAEYFEPSSVGASEVYCLKRGALPVSGAG